MQNTTRAGAIDRLSVRPSSTAAVVGFALAALAAGCSSNSEPTDKASPAPSPFVVSSPLPNAPGTHLNTGVAPHGTSAASTIVYIALPPGAMPTGVTVTVADAPLGSSVSAAFVDGGFDPVSLAADAGDTLTFTVRRADTTTVTYMRAVPGDGPPIVVRTSPPVHKRDVPLNAIMVVVFSEPIDAASLKVGAIQLWRGATSVPGHLAAGDPLHLTALFAPDSALAGLTEYELRVTQAVTGLDGTPLKAPVAAPFTTAPAAPTPHFTIGGTASGLQGSGLVLQNRGADPLAVTANGTFTFATALDGGAAYHVTVFAQPTSPAQSCSVTNGSGAVTGADVSNVLIACTTIPPSLVFASVSAGGSHTCGLTTSGAAYCWGDNSAGELGDGTSASSLVPVAVAGGLTFQVIDVANGSSCGVAASGAAYCWGNNSAGELGDGTSASSLVPVAVAGGLTFAPIIAAGVDGDDAVCGVTTTGSAYCWGFNAYGDLGDGTTTSSATPRPVAGGLTFRAIITQAFTTCGVTTSGDAYCWGRNHSGQLGDGELGDGADRATPVQVLGGLAFATISVGEHDDACGVTTAGELYCWGSNTRGSTQCGVVAMPPDPDFILHCATRPILVPGGLTFATVSLDLGGCGLTTSGSAYCWDFPGPAPQPVSGGHTFATISTGNGYACGVTTGGVAYCWGINLSGQLGDGTTNGSSLALGASPVKVAGQP